MLKWVLIAAAGGAGSVLRYAAHTAIAKAVTQPFPIGTFVINVVGCFAIGAVTAHFSSYSSIREEYRLAITVGLLGGFTTFSSFGLEAFQLLTQRQVGTALSYVAGSCLVGLAAVWLGWRLVESAM
jgi:fluoride exporter